MYILTHFQFCTICMHVLLCMIATALVDFLDLANPFDAPIGVGRTTTSMEPLKPPLQYIGKLYKGFNSQLFITI